MNIKVGDKFRHKSDGDTGEVISVWRGRVVIGWNDGCVTNTEPAFLHEMAAPITEPARAPLTGAQVAQVLEAVADAYKTWSPLGTTRRVPLDQHLRNRAQSERERGHG